MIALDRKSPLPAKARNAQQQQYVVFTLAGAFYAIPVNLVREVLRMPTITPLPDAPGFIAGAISVRGRVLAVVDLHVRFGLAPPPAPTSQRVLVVQIPEGWVGLIVDGVEEVRAIDADAIEPVPLHEVMPNSPHLAGIIRGPEGLILVIQPRSLFNDQQQTQLKSLWPTS
jgi:purine-binding chemotaxis protein CheW